MGFWFPSRTWKVETVGGRPVQFRATGSSAEMTAGPKSKPRCASGGYSVHFRNPSAAKNETIKDLHRSVCRYGPQGWWVPFWNCHSICVTERAGSFSRSSRWCGRCRSRPGRKCILSGHPRVRKNKNINATGPGARNRVGSPIRTGWSLELLMVSVWM